MRCEVSRTVESAPCVLLIAGRARKRLHILRIATLREVESHPRYSRSRLTIRLHISQSKNQSGAKRAAKAPA